MTENVVSCIEVPNMVLVEANGSDLRDLALMIRTYCNSQDLRLTASNDESSVYWSFSPLSAP